MKIRVWLVSGIVFGALGMAFASVPAQAKNKTVKECTAEWKAAEAAKTTGGKKRADFIAACRQEEGAAPAAAAPAEPAPATKPMATKPMAPKPMAPKPMAPKPMATAPKPMEKPATTGTKTGSPGREAYLARLHGCSAEWKADKANGTRPAGMKWPQFWHECDQRMKAKGM
jgi:hypothetical protein